MRLISLGRACETAFQIRIHTTKVDADFFDWLITPFDGLMTLLRNDLADHLNPEDLYLQEDRNFINNSVTGIQYGHVFLRDPETHMHPDEFLNDLPRVRSIFNHLTDKFFRNADLGQPIGFVRRQLDRDQALMLEAFLRGRFPNLPFRIIAVNAAPLGVSALDPTSFTELVIAESGPDGLGLSEEWGAALLAAGLTDAPFQKTKEDVFQRLMSHMVGDVDTLVRESQSV